MVKITIYFIATHIFQDLVVARLVRREERDRVDWTKAFAYDPLALERTSRLRDDVPDDAAPQHAFFTRACD